MRMMHCILCITVSQLNTEQYKLNVMVVFMDIIFSFNEIKHSFFLTNHHHTITAAANTDTKFNYDIMELSYYL